MISKRKQKYIALMALIPLLLSLFIAPTHAATVNESESNNTYSTADVTADDNNNYGKLSSTSDVDWWKMTFTQTGMVNFWLGGISSSYTYNMDLYEPNSVGSVYRVAYTTTTAPGAPGLIRARVYPNVTYYVKISSSSSVSTSNYLFRAKRYALNPAKVFTFDFTKYTTNLVFQTHNSALLTLPHLNNMGFSSQELVNYKATNAFTELPSSDIVLISSHGDAGILNFKWTPEDGDSNIYAKNFSTSGTLSKNISDYAADALSSIDLLVLSSCESSADYNAYGTSIDYGNLITEAKNKGVFCAVGWHESINSSLSDRWLNQYFYQLSTGATVQHAITMANYYCDDLYDPDTYTYEEIAKIKNVGTGTSPTTALIIG